MATETLTPQQILEQAKKLSEIRFIIPMAQIVRIGVFDPEDGKASVPYAAVRAGDTDVKVGFNPETFKRLQASNPVGTYLNNLQGTVELRPTREGTYRVKLIAAL